jgi:hypothetical protein
MATEAVWLNGNNPRKENQEKTKRKERKSLTLTGLLMEGLKR